jgi:NAD(P)-dependent dehydrogenase (short-subunit alcohol dehydrogenase family)
VHTPEAISAEMLDNETFERWSETYTINTASYYFSTFAFLPLLCKAKESAAGEAGNVICVSSMSGITNTSQRGQVSPVARRGG